MFTGIVTDVGKVVSAEQRGDLRLRIQSGYDMGTVVPSFQVLSALNV